MFITNVAASLDPLFRSHGSGAALPALAQRTWLWRSARGSGAAHSILFPDILTHTHTHI